jgi:hypothetical protein
MSKPKAPKPILTPEEKQARAEAAALEAKRLATYGGFLQSASHRQLQGELKRTIRAEHFKEPGKKSKTPIPGLTILFATILSTVLDNTKTQPINGQRKDQINPKGKLHAYPL